MAGVFPAQFDHPVATIDEVAEEIKHGRCRPFFKEIPKSGATVRVTEITIGTKGEDELRNRIIVKQIQDERRWQNTRETVAITETLCRNGFKESTFRVPKTLEVNETEHLLIEEGQRGKSFFDVLPRVHYDTGQHYFELAARWLARLHNLKLRVNTVEDLLPREHKRFDDYTAAFSRSNSPYAADAHKCIERVSLMEEDLIEDARDAFVQVHGDYHPKNIIIGRDRAHDPSTVFISVIDFNSSLLFHPAFDVGYFLSQFNNQFSAFPALLEQYHEERFIETYRQESEQFDNRFPALIDMFKLRANLSIASYLIKVGKGESPEMSTLMTNSLTLLKKLS